MKSTETENRCRTYRKPDTFFIGYDGELRCRNTRLLLKVSGDSLQAETASDQETGQDTPDEELRFNCRRFTQNKRQLVRGDRLEIGAVQIEFFEDYIRVYGAEQDYESSLEQVERPEVPFAGFPDYKRSPRIIKRAPKEQLELKSPPENPSGKKGSLAMTVLPPLATVAVTVGIGLLMGRGTYLLMSVGASGITIALSVVRFFSDRKEQREISKKRKENYQNYLLAMRKRIFALYEAEQETYRYNYPETEELFRMAHSWNSRIYERSASDKDFLTISIGRVEEETSFCIQFQEKEMGADTDELYQQAQSLKKEYSRIDKARVIDLKTSQFGLVGEKELIHRQLQDYICQLCFFQSYHDLQIITLYHENYGKQFQWMKWLPHCRIRALNVRGLIDSENVRDQILNSMNQILKERKQKLEESKKEERFRPHFLFIIDEPQLIMEHSIMELLEKDGQSLGFSVIYTSYLRANLPENVGTVLMLNHAEEGTLLLEDRIYRDETIRLPQPASEDLELFSRDLGVLNHLLGTTSHIPEQITFFDLYGVQMPEQLQAAKRWREHRAEKSLAVPLGVRAVDDIVELNLHEKAHGPHGLVAGTTGSGKSEIIQSYILSLAVNFHPHEAGFLLIDYKGGGMAGLFQDLPHLLGTITNLDGGGSMRALASIKSELARRQKLFSENNVNHINAYMELFREGAVQEPIPHLFLISDEFAELKKEQPEFMKELVSTARIGRSLGVHLILATQKPTGVVDDQIWSNSKFKLALKVQDESDSKEIIKTPDAAAITQPGRAYLQVGNNEIYELFQSAWSGAAYVKEQEKEVTLDNRVYMVNKLGQGVLLNEDLGGSREEKAARETQLDAVVRHIKEVYEKEDAVPVRKPWLPALAERIVSPEAERDILSGMDRSGAEKPQDTSGQSTERQDDGLAFALGVVDIPEEQKQEEYILDFTKDGNLMYIASSGYGKSVLLTTVAMSLAFRYSLKEVNLFLLDFGNNALIALQRLPHTSEYIALDDVEKYEKFKKLLTKELAYRKKKMAEVYAQNFQVYNQTAKEPLTAWVILVDNFDAVKEMGFEQEEYFTKASRDGVSLGVYFVIAATRNNAIRGATFNNFKNKIAGFNFEKGEVLSLVGRSSYTLPETKGRALIKAGERVSMMQIYTMVDAADDVAYRKGLQQKIEELRDKYAGQEASHMPVMPEELDMEVIRSFRNPGLDLFVGLDSENVELQGISYTNSPYMILGAVGSGKTNLLKVFLQQLIGRAQVTVFDAPGRDLKEYAGAEGVSYIKDMQEFVAYMDRLEAEVIRREQELAAHREQPEEETIRGFSPYVVMIDDLSSFYSHKTSSQGEIAEMFGRAANVGILMMATNLLNKFYGGDAVTEFFKRSIHGMLVSPQGHTSVAPVDVEPGLYEGALYSRGRGIIVRIPKA